MLLRRPLLDRHVLQVDPHAGPRGRPPAHRIDEDVRRLQEGRGFRIAAFPGIELLQCLVFAPCPCHLDQRVFRNPSSL